MALEELISKFVFNKDTLKESPRLGRNIKGMFLKNILKTFWSMRMNVTINYYAESHEDSMHCTVF